MQSPNIQPIDNQDHPLNWGRLFAKYARFWPIIFVCMFLGIGGSFFYLKYTQPVFSVSMKLMIKDDKNSGQLSESAIFQDLALGNSSRNLENEMEILKSGYLMRSVIKLLNLQYSYVEKGRFRNVEVYKTAMYSVAAWQPVDSVANEIIQLDIQPIDDQFYQLSTPQFVLKGKIGSPLSTPLGNLTLVYNGRKPMSMSDMLQISIATIPSAARRYANALFVRPLGKKATVVEIAMNDPLSNRATDILTELVNVYNNNQLQDKNTIFRKTLTFIDERLKILAAELGEVEGDVERFKSRNNLLDLSTEAEMVMKEATTYNQKFTENEVQLNILEGIENQLSKEGASFEFVPSNIGVTNLSLSSLLLTFNQLMLDRKKANSEFGPNHPGLALLENQLASIRLNILNNIKNIKSDYLLQRQSLQQKELALNTRLKSLPTQERQLIEIQRQQSIKQNLYLYLLQKREESAINLAATVGNSLLVEPAENLGKISPRNGQIWLLGGLLGFTIPLAVLGIFFAFNQTIQTKADITTHTKVPILGVVNYAKGAAQVVISEKSRTAIAEMFRLLRANLQFVGTGQNNKTILITSSQSSEGKSFVSLNLGISLAMGKKKVVIIELDMRKPRLAKYLGEHHNPQHPGITQYLVETGLEWQQIVMPSTLHPYLSYVACGILPPNPSELLMSERLTELIQSLQKTFDYVIIDTPPVGLVSDALLLNQLVDTALFIVRYGKTKTNQLEIIDEIAQSQKLPRPYIVFNAVKNGISANGKYGYQYGYYQEASKPRFQFLSSVFRKKHQH